MAQFQQYLDELNEQQKEAVVHEGSPLLILAGAGSGKTRVITTKIGYLISQKNVDPYSILSVTFTKKAANEMKQRAVAIESQAANAQIRTFHSFGSWFLRKYADRAGLESTFTVYDDEDMATLVRKAVPSLSLKEAHGAAKQISLCKDYGLLPEDDLSEIHSDFDLNEVYAAYENRLKATGNVDFGDLIMLPVRVMQENPTVKEYVHNRFRVIMVDEYQDSNIAQYKLLQALSGVEENTGNYVCVVGDDDQSIYHFRGAEVQNILTFPQKFPGTQIIRLEQNYRSTAKILNAASVVVGKNQNRLGKNLIAHRGDGGQPVIAFVPDQTSEVNFCCDLIQKSVSSGGKYSDWAILYRTNAQSLGFEKEFVHNKIPYVIVGSLKFYDREEIKDALAYLSLCANPKDEIAFRRIINKPVRGIGEKTQDKIISFGTHTVYTLAGEEQLEYDNFLTVLEQHLEELTKKARTGAEEFCRLFKTVLSAGFDENKKLSDFIQQVIQDSGLDEYHKAGDEIEGTQRIANLQELVNSAIPYPCSMEGLTAFLDAINLDRTVDARNEESDDDSVTLITLHNTKGLEYNNVIITGLEEGVFPRADKAGADLEEERRLFYVGITRARNELYITSAAHRFMYGSSQYMQPSNFIKEAQGAFKLIGQIPFGFETRVRKAAAPLNFGRNINSFPGMKSGSREEPEDFLEADDEISPVKQELLEKWKKGTKLYHDDFGYGVVSQCRLNEDEVVVSVQFESGTVKKFLPEYQSHSLQIIKV